MKLRADEVLVIERRCGPRGEWLPRWFVFEDNAHCVDEHERITVYRRVRVLKPKKEKAE